MDRVHGAASLSSSSEFSREGYTVISSIELNSWAQLIKEIFENEVYPLIDFSKNPHKSANVLKAFCRLPEVLKICGMDGLKASVMEVSGLNRLVCSGPLTSHYSEPIGHAEKLLPFHQDWPSMAGSKRSTVVWIPISDDATPDTHGIEVIRGSHLKGLIKGQITPEGYMLEESHDLDLLNKQVIECRTGDAIIFSSLLVHRSFLNSAYQRNKLSMSLRFDDFSCPFWNEREFISAYKTVVDRELFLND